MLTNIVFISIIAFGTITAQITIFMMTFIVRFGYVFISDQKCIEKRPDNGGGQAL